MNPIYTPEEEIEMMARRIFEERRRDAAKTILQGLASGLHWQPGLLIHADEMASDAVDLADALLRRLAKDL